METPINKEQMLSLAREHVSGVREKIKEEMEEVNVSLQRKFLEKKNNASDEVAHKLFQLFSDRLDQLHHLFPSPYFSRCDIRSSNGEERFFYFSKFSLHDQSIFSWMTSAARIRFTEIGPASFELPDKTTWSGELIRKDQFMIVNGKIIFLSSESDSYGRTLVHQEKLSQQKAGFMLPEIVERMEKAQDDVIRAPAFGSFLIAGPAGSGKTTLALHRLAYLLQSPDTASQFENQDMIVFVQDHGTQAYFSQLLPDLGIHNVQIVTFGEWAIERLKLKDYTFVRRPNGVDEEIDGFESRKCRALRELSDNMKASRTPALSLLSAYESIFTDANRKRFKNQLEEKQLDRFDLSILLKLALTSGPLTRSQEFITQKKNFEITRSFRDVPLEYSLIVVDEAQNYLAEQVDLLRTCISKRTKAMLYVGDLEQQVLLGTVRDWSHVGETFGEGQKVKLEKVYRNTKKILEYLQEIGFNVSAPEGLREGTSVVDVACSAVEEVDRLKAIVDSMDPNKHVGILSPLSEYLNTLRSEFEAKSNVHILTIHEAQGVEFECVCVVGIDETFFNAPNLTEERLRIKKDLIYVGLTRAMDELNVFGRKRLGEMIRGE